MSRQASVDELRLRFQATQRLMEADGLDAVLLTTEVDVSYFAGLASQFWHSPTRPIALILPRTAKGPIAVVPEIMEAALRATWVERVITWPAIQETIVATIVQALQSVARDPNGPRVATPMNVESHVRLPLLHHQEIAKAGVEWVDGSALVHKLRRIKSAQEISCVRRACEIASDVLRDLPNPYNRTEREVARSVRIAALLGGADAVPYVMVSSGANGYESIASGPTDRRLQRGNLLVIDVGCTWGGYWCDFNRNYALGEASESSKAAHRILWDATECALELLTAPTRPTYGALWQIMRDYCVANGGNPLDYQTGRMGHGLGRTLTELPSVARDSDIVLRPGMVLTLEPCLRIGAEWMVHEECLVVTETGYSLLTARASRELRVLPWQRSGVDAEPAALRG